MVPVGGNAEGLADIKNENLAANMRKALATASLQLFCVFSTIVCTAQERLPATPQQGDVTAKEVITALERACGLRTARS
jgi:hypothetical protein